MSVVQGFFSALPYFVILIGVLIFVHEAGHFLFAKLFKVKVHVFSLGFGPQLIGFVRGETRYKVSLVPLGGYVKMLGEDPTEEVQPEDRGRAFGDKPLFQRFFIIIGGPLMNLILPFFLHFGVGLSFDELVPAEVGVVLPGTPAAEAGIRPGDIIEAIDGEPVYSFDDLVGLVAPRAGDDLRVAFRREEQRFERTIRPEPTEIPYLLDEKETVGRIGVGPAYLSPVIGVAEPTSVAAQAGLKTFDKIVSVNGEEIKRLVDLERALTRQAGSRVQITVQAMREDAKPPFQPVDQQFVSDRRTITLEIPSGCRGLAELGMESSADFVAYVTPGGAADKIGLRPGDRLVSLDGESYPLGQIFAAIDGKPDATRLLSWTRQGKAFEYAYKQHFVPAGEAGELGVKRDRYDKGFWSFIGGSVLPDLVPNPSLVSRAVHYSLVTTWAGFRLMWHGIRLLFTGRVSLRSLGGPIMIGQLAGQAGQQGVDTFFWLMALISLNLGLLNLLPIPVLDGGQIAFIAVEAVTRQPISRAVKERVMIVGLAMVLLLMIFITWNDIARLMVG